MREMLANAKRRCVFTEAVLFFRNQSFTSILVGPGGWFRARLPCARSPLRGAVGDQNAPVVAFCRSADLYHVNTDGCINVPSSTQSLTKFVSDSRGYWKFTAMSKVSKCLLQGQSVGVLLSYSPQHLRTLQRLISERARMVG